MRRFIKLYGQGDLVGWNMTSRVKKDNEFIKRFSRFYNRKSECATIIRVKKNQDFFDYISNHQRVNNEEGN